MTFKFPRIALPDPPPLWERSMAAKAGLATFRENYRKARQAESTRADEITQGWRDEAAAQRAEQQAARDAEANSNDPDE